LRDELVNYVFGIGADATDEVRGDRPLIRLTDNVQARLPGHGSVVLGQPIGVIEAVDVEPAVVGTESGAPDHGGRSDGATVFEERVAVADVDDSWQPFNACRLKLAGPDPAQRLRFSLQSSLG
jgi:hypothetical protein